MCKDKRDSNNAENLQTYMDKVLEVFADVHDEAPQVHFEVIL